MTPRPSGTHDAHADDATSPAGSGVERALALLRTWLPGRAADQLLRAVAQADGRPLEALGDADLAALLVGPVYRELRTLVPRDTLRRELKRLARDLAPRPSTARADAPPLAADDAVTDNAVTDEQAADEQAADASIAGDPGVEPPGAPTPAAPPVDPPSLDAAERSAEPSPAPARSAARPAATAALAAEDVLMALAVLDGVDGAVTFDAVGSPLGSRGAVPDEAALGRVLAAGGHLLRRHGDLRSVGIVTTDGTLVAVPVSDRWIAVSGAPDMNLGAVYAALTALEEER